MSARHVIRLMNAAMALAAGICMLVLMTLTTGEVISRSFFHAPTSWSLEVVAYLLAFCIFFGMSYSIERGAHVSIPLLYNKFSKRIQRVLDIATSILLLCFWIVLFWQSLAMALDYLVRDIRSETMLAAPLFYPMMVVAIGSFTCCLQAVITIYDKFLVRVQTKD